MALYPRCHGQFRWRRGESNSRGRRYESFLGTGQPPPPRWRPGFSRIRVVTPDQVVPESRDSARPFFHTLWKAVW